jgi:hypothetical protein
MKYHYRNCNNFRLALMQLETQSTLTQEDVEGVLYLVDVWDITREDFVALDEKPGTFGDYTKQGWHWKLRQVRNQHIERLFSVLEANERKVGVDG